jgi:hypothetical protein
MTFVQRTIDVVFTLGNTVNGNPNNFKENINGANTVRLSGLRVSAKITRAGFPQLSHAQLAIYGMTKSLMDQLSTLGMQIQLVNLRNIVTVLAGDAVNGQSIVFIGTITQAWGDYSAQPEVPFYVEADTALGIANSQIPFTSFKGSADAVVILSGLANQAGLHFENNGVSGIRVYNPYYYGSPLDQIKKCKQAIEGQVGITVDDTTSTLAIWPKNGSRNGVPPLISPGSGMVGYPNYNANGISLKTIFNPSVGFMKKINVQSSLGDAANGEFVVYGIDHDLESQVFNGQWFSVLQAQRTNLPFPVAK